MSLIVKDRVRENSTTTGTGTLTLSGAVSGFQTFSGAIGNGNTTYYTIVNGTEWEVGLGTVGTTTLSRDTVLSSSNSGSLVNFSSGTKDVFCTYPATKAMYQDANGSATSPQLIASNGMVVNNATVSSNYTIPTGYNAMSVGAITLASGISVTVPSGNRWFIL